MFPSMCCKRTRKLEKCVPMHPGARGSEIPLYQPPLLLAQQLRIKTTTDDHVNFLPTYSSCKKSLRIMILFQHSVLYLGLRRSLIHPSY